MQVAEVRVVVYEAKNLPTKKKGKHKYLVVFGVGEIKFATSVVQDFTGNPIFRTEANITVEDASYPLTLTVLEKDEVLGQIAVPLDTLTKDKERKPIRQLLQPHKKCPKPQGELTYAAWPVSFKESSLAALKGKEFTSSKTDLAAAFGKVKLKMLRKSRSKQNAENTSQGMNSNLSASNKMLSVSCYNLAGLPDAADGLDGKAASDMDSSSSYSVSAISGSSHGADSSSFAQPQVNKSAVDVHVVAGTDSKLPEVSGISPREGWSSGGTRLTIRGTNLGLHKEDIVGLFVCGSNVLASLEYESSRKIYCTTRAYKPSSGKIVVETQSGGRGTSLVDFTFIDVNATRTTLSRQSSGGSYDVSSMERGEAEGMRSSDASLGAEHHHGHRKMPSGNSLSLSRVSSLEKSASRPTSLLIHSTFDEDLHKQLVALRDENKSLQDKCKNYQTYIDRLTTRIMIMCPEILCVDH